MFRTGFLSIIRSLVLYTQQLVYVIQVMQTALISQIYFWNRTLRVSDRFSVHHQESSTVYTAIGKCHKVMQTALISQIYFWNRTVRVSDRFSVHHQESSTVYTAPGLCHTGYADCLLDGSSSILHSIL